MKMKQTHGNVHKTKKDKLVIIVIVVVMYWISQKLAIIVDSQL